MKKTLLTVSADGGSVTLHHDAILSVLPDEFHLYSPGEQSFIRLYREKKFLATGPIGSPDVQFDKLSLEHICLMLIPIIMIDPEVQEHLATLAA